MYTILITPIRISILLHTLSNFKKYSSLNLCGAKHNRANAHYTRKNIRYNRKKCIYYYMQPLKISMKNSIKYQYVDRRQQTALTRRSWGTDTPQELCTVTKDQTPSTAFSFFADGVLL